MSVTRSSGPSSGRRLLRSLCAAAVAAASLVALPLSPAQAVGSPADTTVSSEGGAASNVAVGDTLDVATSSPVTETGSVDQTITQQWDPAAGILDPATLVAPDGWTVTYDVDGTWTSSAPSSAQDLAMTDGVRATSTMNSGGLDGSGKQLATSHGNGTLKVGAGSFQGSSGGDGWDVFVAGSKVLNIYHHNNSQYGMDCHIKSTGASCTGSVYYRTGFVTSGASTGSVVAGRVYSIVGSANGAGVLCTDIRSNPFTDCGFTVLQSGAYTAYGTIGKQTISGTKVYAPVLLSGTAKLLCYDVSTSAACAGQPYALAGLSGVGSVPAFSVAIDGKVYVTANKVWCLDAATDAACAGSWPVGSLSAASSVAPMRDAQLDVVGVCAIRGASACWDLTGASATVPTGLASALSADPAGSMGTWSDFSWSTQRQYWFSGGSMFCYDWLTDASCAGFTPPSVSGDRYALTVDPTDARCIWTNGDSGQITTFDGLTGAAGCPPPVDPTLEFAHTTTAPRLSCDETGRVREWRSITLTPSGAITASDLRVTVVSSGGEEVAGFVGLTPDAGGVIDLTALSVADTGTQPTFEVTALGATSNDASDVTADVLYVGDPAQVCFSLDVQRDCPTLTAGVQNGDTVPVAATGITGTTVTDDGSGAVTRTAEVSVTRADQSGCIGSVSGTVVVSPPGGPVPVEDVTVTLAPAAGGAAYATATTDADGDYAFPYVRPGGYRVSALGTNQTVTVTDGAQDADVSLPVDAPVAGPVTISTLQGVAGSAPVSVTVDEQADVDTDSVVLQDPSDSSWGTTLVVDDEGTWTVLGNGSLRFTPLNTFTGTSTDVTYRVADSFGTTDTAAAHAVVQAVRPTAHPVRSTGVQGSTQTITPDGRSRTLAIDASTVRVVDPQTGNSETVVTVAGVGTFTADTTHGKVVLVPEGDFVGSYTVIYEVSDILGRAAVSTITAVTTELDPSTQKVTVDSGAVARVTVRGVPSGATVSGPATVSGKASAVAYSRTRITVTPVAGYAGLVQVPYTATNGTATVQRVAKVSVRPLGAGRVTYKVGYGNTVVTWAASGSRGVTGYEVWVDGAKRCSTSATTCTVDGVFGPKAEVSVVAVGPDGSRTRNGATGRYTSSAACGGVSAVYFDVDSSVLTGDTRATLAKTAADLKAQGFTKVCLVGFTDANGSAAYNLALSKRRVNAVGGYLSPKLGKKVSIVKDFSGEADPAAPNDTADGRAANRRVEVRVG